MGYNAEGAHPIRGIVNKVGMGHLEPRESSDFNPALASLTAAWFKIYLDETPVADEVDYHELVFGKMCDGVYDGEMQQCEVHDGATPTPSDCPGGSLGACIALCPEASATVYQTCVDICLERCSGSIV